MNHEADKQSPIDQSLTGLIEAIADKMVDKIASAVSSGLDGSALMGQIEALASSLDNSPIPKVDRTQKQADSDTNSSVDKKTCSEPDCQEAARARGLCSKHYQRLRYAEKRAAEEGDPLPTSLSDAAKNRSRKPARKTAKRGGGTCSMDGCDQDNYAKGMCGKHFMEWVRSRKDG